MTKHLFVISIGSVQDFISAARRTRDLWFGSHLLSEISKAAAKAIAEEGGELIFPALERGHLDLEPSDEVDAFNVANIIVAELPESITDPSKVNEMARIAAKSAWLRYANETKKEADKLDRNAVNPDIWQEQVTDVDEQTFDVIPIYAAWVLLGPNYQKDRKCLMRLLSGRKSIRDFNPPTERHLIIPKSSLDGARESVLTKNKNIRKKMALRLRLGNGEQLCAVALTKRLGGGKVPFWGAINTNFKLGEEYHETIFGTTEDSGHIIFHDAWITPESLEDSMKPDVMTPHHGDYYSKKDEAAPTDFDDPNPITFLSIAGSFHVAVSCDVQSEDGEKWAKLAFKMLTEALREWGIGGKINAGYGRLVLAGLDNAIDQKPAKIDDSKPPVPGPDVQRPSKPPQPATKKLKYKNGDTVEVTKVPDPKEKRGASYFVADDGIGGLVVLGTPSSVEMGQKTRLEINGVMEKEGLYNFAAVGAKKEPPRQARDKRGRR
jgi:CRISPR type III-B/RAMP module RAMP protein Cmr6